MNILETTLDECYYLAGTEYYNNSIYIKYFSSKLKTKMSFVGFCR